MALSVSGTEIKKPNITTKAVPIALLTERISRTLALCQKWTKANTYDKSQYHNPLSDIRLTNVFSHSVGCSLLFPLYSLPCRSCFVWCSPTRPFFAFVACALRVLSVKSLPIPRSWRVSPVFSSSRFTVSGLKCLRFPSIWIDYCVWCEMRPTGVWVDAQHQGIADQSHSVVSSHICWNGFYWKNQKTARVGEVVERLEPLHTGAVAMENNMEIPQKTASIKWSCNPTCGYLSCKTLINRDQKRALSYPWGWLSQTGRRKTLFSGKDSANEKSGTLFTTALLNSLGFFPP